MLRPPSPPRADFSREAALIAAGRGPVAGVDEAGRGPLAGPVVACAVILDPRAIPAGLADSKVLKAAVRETLAAEIRASALAIGLCAVPAAVIDRIDIRQATLLAMRRAVTALALTPGFVLVDGNDPPDFGCARAAVVDGDARVASIAAASIIAKVTRDAMMRRLDSHEPAYGFIAHVGYGTAMHRAALASHGPCREHRLTFAPVRGLLARETV